MVVIKCSCGCGLGENHIIGKSSCFREVVQKNEDPIKRGDMWLMPEGVEITDRTLRNQRGYSQHESFGLKVWSRPKDGGSENSITA